MESNLDKYKKDLENLLEEGEMLLFGMVDDLDLYGSADPKTAEHIKKAKKLNPKLHYEKWYTEALKVIQQIIPDRLEDFKMLYKNEKRKKLDYLSYTVSDYIIGVVIRYGDEITVNTDAAFRKFQQQISILQSAQKRFMSSLFDIKQLLQADLFDSELDTALELNKKGFLRGAGAIAGVILEKHLSQICDNHKIKISKKNPTIADFNDKLKEDGVYEIPTWRKIQHLGDLRNLCDHNKEKEPSPDDVEELINGVAKVIKTIF